MADDPVPHPVGKVEPGPVVGQLVHHPQGVQLVVESSLVLEEVLQHLLPPVPERGVPQVVPEGDGLGQIHVQAEGPADGRGDGGHVQGVLHPGADMVVVRGEEHLGLVFQPPEGHGMDDGGLVPEIRAPDVLLAGADPFGVDLGFKRVLQCFHDAPVSFTDVNRIEFKAQGLKLKE